MGTRGLACAVLLMTGCVNSGDEGNIGTTRAPLSVTWTNMVGVSAAGNDLTKTDPASAWNAGASSVQTLAGDGYVEFTTAEATTAKMAGLSVGDSGQAYGDIDFAIRLKATGRVGVYEGGVLRGGNFTTYAAGDLFRIEVKAGVVTYAKNGAVFYTSAAAPSFPLGVDTSLNTPGATVNDVNLVSTSLHWQNAVGVNATDNDLTKTGTLGWNAGASSIEYLEGDGFVELTAGDNTTARMAGLGNDDTSQHYADIEYAIYLKSTGMVSVYESGVVVAGNVASYLPGDIFRVEVSGGVVTYSMNGGLPFYTSVVAATFPLRVDTSLNTPGATINDVALVEASNACPAYLGNGPICDGTFVVNNAFDLAEIAGCASITGNLTIDAPGMTVIALPNLERVGGYLSVNGGADLQRLRLPQLKEVGADFGAGFDTVTANADVSRLQSVNLSVAVGGTHLLGCLESSGSLAGFPVTAPRLQTVAGDIIGTVTAASLLTVTGTVYAESLDAPLLTDIGGTLTYSDDVDVPSLQRAGAITVEPNTTDIDLRDLVDVTGAFQFLGGPPVLDFPALQHVGGFLAGYLELQEIHLPALAQAGPSATTANVIAIGAETPTDFPALTSVRGGLDLASSASFPLLTEVAGDLSAYDGSPPGDTVLNVPALALIRGDLFMSVPLNAPALAEVRGDLATSASASLPVLTLVRGSLNVSPNDSAPFDAPLLGEVRGEITIGWSATSLSLPSLSTCGSIYVSVSQLATLDLPALTTVWSSRSIGGRVYIGTTAITALSMPALQTTNGKLIIYNNVAGPLTSIDFPALTSVGDALKIHQDQSLPLCYATNLCDQLQAAGWTGTCFFRHLDRTGTCP